MTSTKDLLASHEELIFDLRPHWIELAGAVLWTIVIAAGVVVGGRRPSSVDLVRGTTARAVAVH
jgi:hypothetical protein